MRFGFDSSDLIPRDVCDLIAFCPAAHRDRFLATWALVEAWCRCQRQFPELTQAELLDGFRLVASAFAERHGLHVTLRTLRRYARRIDPNHPEFDFNVDRRGRRRTRTRRGRPATRLSAAAAPP